MKSILSLFILLSLAFSSSAQDPNFTQKTGNINHYNPALVGAQSDFGVQANYNNQWPKFPDNPTAYSLLTNYNLKNGLGFGLESKHETYGLLKQTSLKTNINYSHSLGEIEARYGLNLGLGQKTVDWEQLRFEDQVNPSTGFVNPTAESFVSDPKNFFTFDLGAAAYYKGFMFGAAVQQLNSPNISVFKSGDSPLPSRFVGNLGYFKEFDILSLAGTATYQQQGKFSILETQIYSQYKFAKLGVGYHQTFGTYFNTDYLSASAGVQFDMFSLSYSYADTPFGTRTREYGGTHQATAAWYIKGLYKEKGMSRFMNVIL